MANYSEKLKDPKWQKKRLEILNRDEWTCQVCGNSESTLHVHHFIYEKTCKLIFETQKGKTREKGKPQKTT